MAIARDDLGRDGFRAQAQFGADVFFDGGVDVCECADRAGNRTRCDFPAGLFQPVLVAIHFGVKTGKGQAHGGGFGVNAVAAPDADRVLMFIGAGFQRVQHLVHHPKQDVSGTYQLHVECGVQNVRRCHALMHKAGFVRANMFSEMGQKRDDVVFGDRFDFVDPRDIEFDVLGLPDRIGIGTRDHAQISLRIAGVGFDFVPDAELGGGFPDGDHFGAGITGDHSGAPLL